MVTSSDGEGSWVPLLSHQLSPMEVNMDLTRCGLPVERAEELAPFPRAKELERRKGRLVR